MGNPCADYEGYREYAIATLTQLNELDGRPIERSERIKALQGYASIEGDIARSCARYRAAREAELLESREGAKSTSNHVSASVCRAIRFSGRMIALRASSQEIGDAGLRQGDTGPEEEDDDETFWKRTGRHTPEERAAIAERFLRKQQQRNREREREPDTRIAYRQKLFSPDGKPCNVNQPRVSFKLDDQLYRDRIVLEVSVHKYAMAIPAIQRIVLGYH